MAPRCSPLRPTTHLPRARFRGYGEPSHAGASTGGCRHGPRVVAAVPQRAVSSDQGLVLVGVGQIEKRSKIFLVSYGLSPRLLPPRHHPPPAKFSSLICWIRKELVDAGRFTRSDCFVASRSDCLRRVPKVIPVSCPHGCEFGSRSWSWSAASPSVPPQPPRSQGPRPTPRHQNFQNRQASQQTQFGQFQFAPNQQQHPPQQRYQQNPVHRPVVQNDMYGQFPQQVNTRQGNQVQQRQVQFQQTAIVQRGQVDEASASQPQPPPASPIPVEQIMEARYFKLVCFNCGDPGHFVGNCIKPKICFICGLPDHPVHLCPDWFTIHPCAAYFGSASSGLGFYHVDAPTEEETRWVNIENCAIVNVRKGDLNVQQLEKNLNAIFCKHKKWPWQIREVDVKNFLVRFPPWKNVPELIEFPAFDLEADGVTVKILHWDGDCKPLAELPVVWIQVRGLPPKKCAWKTFAQAASCVGILMDVD
ncbi:hypothetical protein ACQ4PT_032519 [Festuca glaucescens]